MMSLSLFQAYFDLILCFSVWQDVKYN